MDRTAQHPTNLLARLALASFIVTFVICRITVTLMESRKIPNMVFHAGHAHIHHMNYGIFLLCGTGAFVIFRRPAGNMLYLAAILYGLSMGLIFDEYGMWTDVGGSYWKGASFNAVLIVSALLGLIVIAPYLVRFRARQWVTAVVVIILLTSVGKLLARPVQRIEKKCMSRLIHLEQNCPK